MNTIKPAGRVLALLVPIQLITTGLVLLLYKLPILNRLPLSWPIFVGLVGGAALVACNSSFPWKEGWLREITSLLASLFYLVLSGVSYLSYRSPGSQVIQSTSGVKIVLYSLLAVPVLIIVFSAATWFGLFLGEKLGKRLIKRG